jgi:hypothetical protein
MELVATGQNDSEIARETRIPRTTVRDWRTGNRYKVGCVRCTACGHQPHDFTSLPAPSYAYLLGMYLGDGVLSRAGRTFSLRVAMDRAWPDIALECLSAMRAVLPDNRASLCCPNVGSNCVVATVYSRQLPCLFPQHGPGMKHQRHIELQSWQQELVECEPERFVRGLIHSDGCRFVNRVHVNGKTYAYPRYNFTNASTDIRQLFTDTCDRLGVAWRRMNARNISIARREAVARLDEFVGPKS